LGSSVADQLAAAADENRRTFDQTRPILLAAPGGQPSLAAALWSPGVQDSGAAIAIGGEDEIHDKTTAVLFNEVQA